MGLEFHQGEVTGIEPGEDGGLAVEIAQLATEERVKASGLPWTIVRGAAFMETQTDFVGQGILDTGKAIRRGF